ncbi:MAG: YjiH family protein [Woeseia sp.]|jgi:nucleoside recognition membrane protein YjiH|nr:YjiH family protein [Woeseia sp.]MBT6211234.1 YjiH family protein [Woeseia sp.]
MASEQTKSVTSRSTWLKFLAGSFVGAVSFLYPVSDDGVVTIPIALASNNLTDYLGDLLPPIIVGIVTMSALVSSWFSLQKSDSLSAPGSLRRIFTVSPAWLMLRILGCLITMMIFFQIGPEFVWSEATGHIVLYDLATAIVTIFIFAAAVLPLLTDYGLMELVGTLLSRIFKRAFRLPGRSCIDALASWMSAAPVGVLITSQQFDKGNYSGREAAVIASNFSIVSLPFCVIVAQFVGLSHLFVEYYMTVVVAGLIAALITPRIPPLSRIPDLYSEVGKQLNEDMLAEGGLWQTGLTKALDKAQHAPGFKQWSKSAIHNLFDIWFGLMPPLVGIGTLGLIVAEYTPLFTWLSYPLIPVLELMRLPEAAAAAPALLVGFAEMFLPAVLASNIESELTKFVVITVSISQLIYMSEVGVLIMKTRIPLNFAKLVQIFLIRTAITLPVAAIAAHWFVF